MRKIYIAAAGREVDGVGDLAGFLRLQESLAAKGFDAAELIIDPLRAGWDTPLEERHYRSGCAPLEAVDEARKLIISGRSSCVIISGEDLLKTNYEREERHRLMSIYGTEWSLPKAYTELARVFMGNWGISDNQFWQLAEHLFENYLRTAGRSGRRLTLDQQWYEPVTDLFRGVDCANPVVDFAGRLLLCSDEVADACHIPVHERVAVSGIGLGIQPGDGPAFIHEIAAYRHLRAAFQEACRQAGVNFPARFLSGEALLEVYTCYPVVPLAFLLVTGIALSPGQMTDVLDSHEITVTGGMNLARAPWNNPSLNAMIAMYRRLRDGPFSLGAVHGNGGLGSRQGVVILERIFR